jgi:hypothetical protein
MADVHEKFPVRVILHTRDVQNIMGLSERGARRLIARIKAFYNKKPYEYITVKEFCGYTGIEEEIVKSFLRH